MILVINILKDRQRFIRSVTVFKCELLSVNSPEFRKSKISPRLLAEFVKFVKFVFRKKGCLDFLKYFCFSKQRSSFILRFSSKIKKLCRKMLFYFV